MATRPPGPLPQQMPLRRPIAVGDYVMWRVVFPGDCIMRVKEVTNGLCTVVPLLASKRGGLAEADYELKACDCDVLRRVNGPPVAPAPVPRRR